MANATTIDPKEAAHFGQMAAEWWDPKGSSAMLHRMNPVRLHYIRDMADWHWQLNEHDRRPLANMTALDMGCGAGLLCEPLARLGAVVTGIDAAAENVAVARLHAEQSGLSVSYEQGGIETLGKRRFDLITSLEVVEHVTDPRAFVEGLAGALAPDGLMILSTPNRTTLSHFAMITIAEGTGRIPKGTHDWDKFLTPEELGALVEAAGLKVIDVTGMSFSPMHGFKLSENKALDYFVTAVHAA